MGSKSAGKVKEDIRLVYIDWKRMPKEAIAAAHEADRNFPKTLEQFAKKYHVNRTTMWRWEQEPEFKREVLDEGLGLISVDEAKKMIAVMKCKAMDGNVQAFNALMKISGLGAGTLTADPQDEDDFFKNMTTEELEALEREQMED